MNVHDSEKMLGILTENGYTSVAEPEQADVIVFNTCAIREKAEQKFYSQLGRMRALKKKNSDLKVAVAGCIAQSAKEKIFRRAPFVNYILGPQNIHMINEVLSEKRQIATQDNPDLAFGAYPARREDRVRAWVSIMYGCNNFCSYCVVPYTRGREVSRPGSSIVSEVRTLAEEGYKEVTLLGQNVNSYRSDICFADLLKQIDRLQINRLRFVTSHPRDLSVEVIDAMSELSSLCEHMHLPVQSGSDSILSAMNRGYTYDDYCRKIELLRKKVPGIAITTDIIVGFPGEKDEDHLCTIKAIKQIGFDGVFAFKYSRRKGTRACEMPGQVEDRVKSDRHSQVLTLQDEITLLKNRGLEETLHEVLVEGPSESDALLLCGRTRTNKIVTIPDNSEAVGSFVTVKILKARHHSLHGVNIATESFLSTAK